MKIVEGIAPESGAYLNEVSSSTPQLQADFLSPFFRPRGMNLTGRNPSSALTTRNFEKSRGSMIRTPSFSFTKVLHQTSGTQISSALLETEGYEYHPLFNTKK